MNVARENAKNSSGLLVVLRRLTNEELISAAHAYISIELQTDVI